MFKVIYFPVKTKQMGIKGRGSDVPFLEKDVFWETFLSALPAFKLKGFKNLELIAM